MQLLLKSQEKSVLITKINNQYYIQKIKITDISFY